MSRLRRLKRRKQHLQRRRRHVSRRQRRLLQSRLLVRQKHARLCQRHRMQTGRRAERASVNTVPNPLRRRIRKPLRRNP
jgi:hypothetical protein